jgi:hypothetical protein
MARLQFDESFFAAIRRLPPDRQKAARSALEKFIKEPALPSLHFRNLENTSGNFIINANRGDRIILRRDEDEEGEFYWVVDVGPHDNVYRRWNRS